MRLSHALWFALFGSALLAGALVGLPGELADGSALFGCFAGVARAEDTPASGASTDAPEPASPDGSARALPPMDWRTEDFWTLLWSGRWSEGLLLSPRLRLKEDRGQVADRMSYDPGLNRIIVSRVQKDLNIVPPRLLSTTEFAREYTRATFGRLWPIETKRTLKGGAVESTPNQRVSGGLVNVDIPIQLPGAMKSIFGDGPPNLRVSGSERITIGGTSSWRVNDLRTEGRKRSRFPTLEMRQELNVRLNGTIGDKLHIDIAQNSEASTSLENQIKIYYQGYDDDVIQRVDLGNTNLSLPATQGISYSSRQEGLFGVKMTGRLASWDFTAIASKQEGQADVASFNGGSRQTQIGGQDGKIFDYEFEKRKYFFLDDPDTLVTASLRGRQVLAQDLAVFIDRANLAGGTRAGEDDEPGIATLDGLTRRGKPRVGHFQKMKQIDDYLYVSPEGFVYPYMALRSALSETYTLAVSYVVRDAQGNIVQNVGNYFTRVRGDSLVLKMIRPAKEDQNDKLTQGDWAPTRRLELKNVYNLGVRGIDKESFELEIHKIGGNDPLSLGSTSYLEVLGLDLLDNATGLSRESTERPGAARGPDGRVDPQYIDYESGLLTVPDLRPFDPSCIDLNGAGFCDALTPDDPDSTGFRAPGRTSPRQRALGWRRVENPGAPQQSPLYGYQFVPVSPESAQAETNPNIYDRRDPRDDSKKYYLSGTFKAFQTEINLQRPGILENSETVRMDDNILTRGVDYQITYETGQVRLVSDKARNPNGNLQITYSYTPLFARGNKTLAGFATSYGGSPNWDFSTTLLYESKGVPERRPRLQQEPTRTFLGGLSGSAKARPWLLTRITDALPLVRTNAPSAASINGSLGFSVPNPNTKGDVYLDDMEGVVQTTSAGVSRESWDYSSRPAAERLAPLPDAPLRDTDRMGGLWFSVQRQVQAKDLSPRLETIEGNDFMSVLGVILLPPAPGAVQPWFSLVQPLSETGVDLSEAQYIDIWVNDFNRFHGDNATFGLGKEIRIDLGRVNEDAVWDPRTPPTPANGRLDFEDQNTDGQRTLLEDLGLDGVDSTFADRDNRVIRVPVASPARARELAGQFPEPRPELLRPSGEQTPYPVASETDPQGDDYVYSGQSEDYSGDIGQLAERFRHLNGTENNQRLDSEDLNGNYQINTDDDYFEYTLPLSEEKFTVIDVRNDYNVADPRNGWRLLRVPLNHPSRRIVGSPDLNTVRQLRLWFNGFADTTYLQIASIEIVGNRWERQLILAQNGQPIADTTQFITGKQFDVAVVNNKQNSEYVPPFPVQRIDRVTEREQSLSLEFKNIEPGEQVSAFRPLLRDEDYTLYQTVSYYLQSRPGAAFDSLEFFLRFSSTSNSDTTNVYELATRLDNPNAWRRLDLELSRVSDMKQGLVDSLAGRPDVPDARALADSLLGLSSRLNFTRQLGDGVSLRMYGKPSFSQIRRLQVGVRNVGHSTIHAGAVWFNELRLGEVRRDLGISARTSASVNLGDVGSVSLGFNATNADFLTLGASRGRGTSSRDMTFGAGFNLEKFLPGWNMTLPFNYSTRSSRNTPKFRANDDQIFSGGGSGVDITDSKSHAFSLSARRNSDPGTPWYLKQTVDALGVSFNYQRGVDRGTTQIDSSLSTSGSVSYNMRLAGAPTFRLPGKGTLNPFPSQLALTYTGGHSEQSRTNRTTRFPDGGGARVSRGSTSSSALQANLGFRPISPVTWSLTSQRDLVDANFARSGKYRPVLKVGGIDLGRETNRSERLQVTQGFSLFGIIRPRVTWSGDYTEDHSPSIVTDADVESLRTSADPIPPDLKNIENRNSTQIGMTIPLGQFFRRFTAGRANTVVRGGSGAVGAVPTPAIPGNLTIPDRFNQPTEAGRLPEDVELQREEQRRLEEDRMEQLRDEQARQPAPPPVVLPTLKTPVPADTAATGGPGTSLTPPSGRTPPPPAGPPPPGAGATPAPAPPAVTPRVVPPPVQPARPPEEKKEKKPRSSGIGGNRAPDKRDEPEAKPKSTPAVPPEASAARPDSLATPAPFDSSAALTPGERKVREAEAKKAREAAEKAAEEQRKRDEKARKKQQEEAARLAEKEKPKQPGPSLAQFLFRDLVQFGEVRTNFSLTNRNSLTRVHGTPSPSFRLGLSEEFGELRRAQNSRLSKSSTRAATANSTVQLLRDLSVDAQFQWNDQDNENQGLVSHTRTTTWPSLRFNLSKLEGKLGLRRIFQSFTASSNYEKRDETSGSGLNRNERSTVTNSWRPFFQFDASFKNGVRINFSNDRSTSTSITNQSGLDGLSTLTERTTAAYRLGLAKSLNVRTAGGRSTTVDLTLDLSYNKDVSLTTAPPPRNDVTISTDRFQGRLSSSYRFTNTVSGSLQLSVGQNRDIEARQTDRTIGLQATAAISF